VPDQRKIRRTTVPTYQYACTSCGHQLEAVQSFTDEPLTVCPACEGRLRKQFSAVGIVFKGSGFYRNDSRKKPVEAGAPSSSSSSSSKPAESSGSSSGDSSSGSSSSGSGEKTASAASTSASS
jgi:putative FmdB family regulatory protein